MSNKSKTETIKKSRLDRVLDAIERGGNALPHPFILFMILSGIILVLSCILAKAGVSVTALTATDGGAEMAETTFTVTNLLTKDYLLDLIINFPQTFISFGPLKTAMVVIISIAVAERSEGVPHLDDDHHRIYRRQRQFAGRCGRGGHSASGRRHLRCHGL